ncbi:hypothetical protein KM043_015550 [Ampulex compressa]|nr:hypothetical protein KM043_015550 [Ampulex compressa]
MTFGSDGVLRRHDGVKENEAESLYTAPPRTAIKQGDEIAAVSSEGTDSTADDSNPSPSPSNRLASFSKKEPKATGSRGFKD